MIIIFLAIILTFHEISQDLTAVLIVNFDLFLINYSVLYCDYLKFLLYFKNLYNENKIALGLLLDCVAWFVNFEFYKIFNLEILDLTSSNESLKDYKSQIFNVK